MRAEESHDDWGNSSVELVEGPVRLGSVALTPPLPPWDEPTELDGPQSEVIVQLARQEKDAGITLTGPNGLLKAPTAQVVEAVLDKEL